VENRTSQPQIEAEHDSRPAHHIEDGAKIGERMQGLQSHHHLARAAGKNLERPPGRVGACIDQEGAGESGVKRRQLADQSPLDGAALYGVEIGYVALVNVEGGMEGTEQRCRIAHPPRDQIGLERRVTRAITRLRVHGDSTCKIQYGDNLHQ
jgi:hypothetical protein